MTVHDTRNPEPTEFQVAVGDQVTLWHFHPDLELGERYVVHLYRSKILWRVASVDRPPGRFNERVVGDTFDLAPGGTLRRSGPRGDGGELDGLWLDDRVVLT